MMAEGNKVFTHAKATGDGLDAYWGFASEIEGDKIKKITIYADSQKLSDAFQTTWFDNLMSGLSDQPLKTNIPLRR